MDDITCKEFKHCPKNETRKVVRKPVDPVYVCEHTMAPTITYKSVVKGGRVEGEEKYRKVVKKDSAAGTCEVSLNDLQGLNNQVNCPGGSNGGFVFHYVVEF